MDNESRTELLSELNNLMDQIDECEDAEAEYEEVSKIVVHRPHPSRLEKFDEKEKNNYIISVAGNAPEQPEKSLIGSKTKQKKYEEQLEQYNEAVKKAEADYETKFASERSALKQKDEIEYNEIKKNINSKKEKAKIRLEEAKKNLNNNNLLGTDMKNGDTVETLYSYVINHRCDSLKEAVNLFFEEKRTEENHMKEDEFRKKLLDLIESGFDNLEYAIDRETIKDIKDNIKEIEYYVSMTYFNH